MAEHKLPDGKRWIDGLLELGRRLGYVVDDEYNVAFDGDEDAPADVVWLRSESDRFPLFIFEVESRPSGQMTYNAAKVFSQETELFEKPLFHFHVVVAGGETSGRVTVGMNTFGKFNYRVYRAGKEGDATTALCDVLSQHRRVAERLDVLQLAKALEVDSWPGVDLDKVWRHAEVCGFRATWEHDYAQLAREEPAFIDRLARRLELELETDGDASAQYRGRIGRHCSSLLHAAVLAILRPPLAGRCVSRARAWSQQDDEPLRPVLGRGEELDDFVFAKAPALSAAFVAATDDADGRRWALDLLERVLGHPDNPMALTLSAVAALWMLHIARSGGDEYRDDFERARAHIEAAGGVPRRLVEKPPGEGARMRDLNAWEAELADGPSAAPSWNSFASTAAADRSALRAHLLDLLVGEDPAIDGDLVREALWITPAGGPV